MYFYYSIPPASIVPTSIENTILKFWSSDFHISPIADFKNLMKSIRPNDIVMDESLSGHCHLMGTCATQLSVINQSNGLTLGSCPNELKRRLWNHFRNNSLMTSADIFLCHHAFGLCEAYMVFNKPMILVASTRYEIGRWSPKFWKRLNDNVRAIASKPWNTIAANNFYDREYIVHFTGIKNVEILPNFCGYTNNSYSPENLEVLIGPSRLSVGGGRVLKSFFRYLRNCKSCSTNYTFMKLRDKYPVFEYSDLVKHPAILLIPYQISVMSFFEYYRMNIPIIVPSQQLLIHWQLKYNILSELSWNCVFRRCNDPSHISAHEDSPHPFDPNNITSRQSLEYWLGYGDYYRYPHVIYFDHWSDIFMQLQQRNLSSISSSMMKFNQKDKRKLSEKWISIISKITNKWHESSKPDTKMMWNQRMSELYPETSSHTAKVC
jgi:hypothetical protein